jgi:hypothetical protein
MIMLSNASSQAQYMHLFPGYTQLGSHKRLQLEVVSTFRFVVRSRKYSIKERTKNSNATGAALQA